ncbi:hypothetical protein ACF8R6_07400 [Pseudomonas sp. CJQ_7]|uniref:hypothetical protein n=1 Tax=Pseudomonas sp. CJQ_7 TaxID=3367166 RepID=UPI00370B5F3B
MKVLVMCAGCFQEDGHPLNCHTAWHEVNDRGAYLTECPRGHKTVSVVQQHKFEVLFELGARALLDGYPGEAITRFASSQERFFEFFIRVVAQRNQIAQAVMKQTWQDLVNSSERQYGAYLMLHLLHYGTSVSPNPEKMKPAGATGKTKDWKAFRNAVVHKGYIPSTEEAIQYGELVYNFITSQVASLMSTAGESVQTATMNLIMEAADSFRDVEGPRYNQTMAIPGVVGVLAGTEVRSFREALEQVRVMRSTMDNLVTNLESARVAEGI